MVNDTDRAISAMYACACPSDYDAWFKLLCAIKDAGVPKDEARHWCESGDGFIAADFESKWERGIKEGGAIKAASLFATAFSQGWKTRANHAPREATEAALAYPLPAQNKRRKHPLNRPQVQTLCKFGSSAYLRHPPRHTLTASKGSRTGCEFIRPVHRRSLSVGRM
jgi:hypothetical protein